MNTYKSNDRLTVESFGSSETYEAESPDALAQEFAEVFADWSASTGRSVASIRASFIAGLVKVGT